MTFCETFEIRLILQFQDLAEWLKPIMEIFSWFGYPQAYMIIIAVIYWGFDRKLGLRLAIFLPLVASINSLLKQVIHAPRPYWTDKNIIAIHSDNGFGMPSGHAQSATVWLLAGAYLRNTWFWIFAIILTAGVGISRAYLGVHFPSQILLGWGVGILVISCFLRFESRVVAWLKRQILYYQLLIVLGCTLLIILLGFVFNLLLKSWEMPEAWILNASEYLILDKAKLMNYGLTSTMGNAGGFLGVTMGAIFMHRLGGYSAGGAWWMRLLRILIGLMGIVTLFIGVQVLSPYMSHPMLKVAWRFIGFYLISFSAIYLLPLLFLKMKLLRILT